MAQERGVPFVAPHAMRANEGNPEITVWCPKCEERVVPLRSGLCGWCDTPLAQEPETPDHLLGVAGEVVDHDGKPPSIAERIADRQERELMTPGLPPLPSRGSPDESGEVAKWRQAEIVDWLRENGPAIKSEIAAHFDLPAHIVQHDISALRIAGLAQKTGKSRQGPKGGRNSEEFCAAEHAPPPPEPKPDVQEVVREVEREVQEVVPAPASAPDSSGITVQQQLTVRYLTVLIGWIERSSIVRDQGPPEHVYDRIERLLGIQEGVA